MIRIFFKTAFRTMRQNMSHSVINVLGLALGITCALIIFVFVKRELNFDSQHTQASRIYRIVEHSKKADGVQNWATTAYPLAEALRREFPNISVTQTAGPIKRIMSSTNPKGNIKRFEEKRVMFADADYLRLFDFKNAFSGGIWLAGDRDKAFGQTNAVVLTEKMAERYFGENGKRYDEIIGKILTLNNSDPLVVTGVIRNPPLTTNLLFDLLVNFEFFKANNQYRAANWSGNYEGTTYVSLADGMDPIAFESDLARLKKKYMNAEDNRRISYFLQPLSDVHTNTLYKDQIGGYVLGHNLLWGLASMAVFIILIASVNFINLSTAQAIRRRKEVGIRKTIGSTRPQLFFQFMSEALLLTVVATVISLISVLILLEIINRNFTIIDLDLGMDSLVWLLAAGLVLIITLLAGSYPALVLSGFEPIMTLKPTDTGKFSGIRLREGLIIFQFSIAYPLILATLVVSQQMDFFRNQNLGFTQNAILTITGPKNQQPGKLEAFRERLLQYPGIREVSLSSGAPISANWYGTDIRLKSETAVMARQAEMKVVDLHYQSVFGLKLVAGSWLTRSNIKPNGEGFNGFVINQTAMKMLGLSAENAVGTPIAISEGEAPIVGVVEDFHNRSLQETILPCVMMHWNSDFYDEIQVQLGTTREGQPDLSKSMAVLEAAWKDLFPNDVYKYTFLDESLAKNYIVEELVFNAFRIFAIIAICISCLGLLGLITFTAARRTKEIGVRKVLGASIGSIVGLLSRDLLRLVLVAVVISSPLGWWALNRWLQDFAYKIDIEWWMFVSAAMLSVLIAFATISFQSIKAALKNPVQSLKTD